LAVTLNGLWHFLQRDLKLKRLVRAVPGKSLVTNMLFKPKPVPQLDATVRERLKTLYQPTFGPLAELTGCDVVDRWSQS